MNFCNIFVLFGFLKSQFPQHFHVFAFPSPASRRAGSSPAISIKSPASQQKQAFLLSFRWVLWPYLTFFARAKCSQYCIYAILISELSSNCRQIQSMILHKCATSFFRRTDCGLHLWVVQAAGSRQTRVDSVFKKCATLSGSVV